VVSGRGQKVPLLLLALVRAVAGGALVRASDIDQWRVDIELRAILVGEDNWREACV